VLGTWCDLSRPECQDPAHGEGHPPHRSSAEGLCFVCMYVRMRGYVFSAMVKCVLENFNHVTSIFVYMCRWKCSYIPLLTYINVYIGITAGSGRCSGLPLSIGRSGCVFHLLDFSRGKRTGA
jgi:hypothetical protein